VQEVSAAALVAHQAADEVDALKTEVLLNKAKSTALNKKRKRSEEVSQSDSDQSSVARCAFCSFSLPTGSC